MGWKLLETNNEDPNIEAAQLCRSMVVESLRLILNDLPTQHVAPATSVRQPFMTAFQDYNIDGDSVVMSARILDRITSLQSCFLCVIQVRLVSSSSLVDPSLRNSLLSKFLST